MKTYSCSIDKIKRIHPHGSLRVGEECIAPFGKATITSINESTGQCSVLPIIFETIENGKKATRKQLVQALSELNEYATGNRGSNEGNPYGKPQVRAACRILAAERGRSDYLSWND